MDYRSLLLCGLLSLSAPCPADSETLMQRVGDGLVFPIDHDYPWRAVHVANAAILTPEESPDGRWRMYIRGSGYFPEEDSPRGNYHDSIGLFTQKAHRFSPSGLWKKHSKNPIPPRTQISSTTS